MPCSDDFHVGLYPMHGTGKMLREGLRTRDAHLIEHLITDPRIAGAHIFPRPEPIWLAPWRRMYRRRFEAQYRVAVNASYSWKVPNLRNRSLWWLKTSNDYPVHDGGAVIAWHPLCSASLQAYRGRVVLDLLDNWLIHSAFAHIRASLHAHYSKAFDRADLVFANSEGTVALAREFGRDDVVLMPNGADPERFRTARKHRPERVASWGLSPSRPVVGYGGKIGPRLDFDLIERTTSEVDAQFVFAGPILGGRRRIQRLAARSNVTFLGDIPYGQYPRVLEGFDVAWVPHAPHDSEVGGDAIKIYEYRAAHLPVVTTPIIGADRLGDPAVRVVGADQVPAHIRESLKLGRQPREFPIEHTWTWKATRLVDAIQTCR